MHAHLLFAIAASIALWATSDNVAAQAQTDKAMPGSTSKSPAASMKTQKANADTTQAVKDQAKAKDQGPAARRDAPTKSDGSMGCQHSKAEDA